MTIPFIGTCEPTNTSALNGEQYGSITFDCNLQQPLYFNCDKFFVASIMITRFCNN